MLAGHQKVGRSLLFRALLVHALITGFGLFCPGGVFAGALRLRVASITQGGKLIDRVTVRLKLPGTNRDETHTLEPAYPLQPGTIIRVPGRTVIRLESDNRNTITLEPNTVFTIEALEPEGEAYSMCDGKAIFSVTKALDFFNVSCKRFLAAVRGTEFSVEANPATKIRYEVTEGRVLVSRIVKVRVGEDQSNAVDELASEELSRSQKPRAEYPLNEDEYIYKFRSYQDALDHYKKSLVTAKSMKDYLGIQQILTSLGIIQARLGRVDLSIPYFDEALSNAKALRDNKRIAWALNNLGISYFELSDYTRSLEFQLRALVIRRTLYSEMNIEITDSYHNLARTYHALDDFCPALDYGEKALKIKRQLLSGPRREIGESLLNIGAVFFDLGRYDKAIAYQEQALAMWEKLYPKRSHPYIALSYQNLGRAWQEIGQVDAAIRYQKNALDLLTEIFPSVHPDVARSYDHLGLAYLAAGKSRLAVDYIDKGLTTRRKVFQNRDHASVAYSLNNLGEAYLALGDSLEAKSYFQSALDMRKRLYSKDNLVIAESLSNLAQVAFAGKDHQAARTLWEQTLDIRRRFYPGGVHPSVGQNYRSLALVFDKLGDSARAKDYQEKARRNDIEMTEPPQCEIN